MAASLPVVALVGRPNVGKSTLFNRLTRSRDALVADQPGLTRDRHYRRAELTGGPVLWVDTGGIVEAEDQLGERIVEQSLKAVEEADLLLLVVDGRAGLAVDDRELALRLRRTGKPLTLVVNKAEGRDEALVSAEFASLGIARCHAVSSAHGSGVDELLEQVERDLAPIWAQAPAPVEVDGAVRVAVLGRPNAGKSTLINRLAGEERLVVSDVAGTTRDAIDVAIERDGQRYIFVDTAGIRRRARVVDKVEKFSVIKAFKAIEEADIVVVLVDSHAGVAEQDLTIIGETLKTGRGLVIALNKWDGLEPAQRQRVDTEVERRLDFVPYVERVHISGLHGSGFRELMRAIKRVERALRTRPSTRRVTEALEAALANHQPAMSRGRAPKLRYAHLGGQRPFQIVIHGSRTSAIQDSYKRYLESFFRNHFKLVGLPIHLILRDGENPYVSSDNG